MATIFSRGQFVLIRYLNPNQFFAGWGYEVEFMYISKRTMETEPKDVRLVLDVA